VDVLENENRKLKIQAQHYRSVLEYFGISPDDPYSGQPQRNGPDRSSCVPATQTKSQASVESPSSQSNSQNVITVVPLLTKPEPPKNQPGIKLFNGTKLEIFGMRIDAAEFDDEFEDTKTVKSYQGLLLRQKAALSNPHGHDEAEKLPKSKSEALQWARWYFLAIHPFAPVVHKADFMALVGRSRYLNHDVLLTSLSVGSTVSSRRVRRQRLQRLISYRKSYYPHPLCNNQATNGPA
jgi:hypothetical protein